MLTAASLGMLVYGVYTAAVAVADLIGPSALELWAAGLELGLALILMLSAAFVRVMLPGGLALAMGSLFGLQALSLHHAAHVGGQIALFPQIVRGIVAAGLVLLAYLGARGSSADGG
jgi:hypothetical protein